MSDSAIAAPETRLQNFLERAGLRGFPWITAIVLYTISWGWLFIVRDSYWADDWNAFLHPEITPFNYGQMGLAPWLSLNDLVHDNFGPEIFRVMTFVFFFCSGLCVFGINKRLNYLSKHQNRLLSLLFILLPFNTARVALMVAHYTEGIFLFFFAWYLLIIFKNRFIKFCCLVLFFLSFQMHSLLFFYLLPAATYLYLSQNKTFRKILIFLVKNFLFFLLPAIFVTLRYFFWNEKVGYHTISFSNLKIWAFSLLALLILISLIIQMNKKNTKENHINILITGLVTLFLGLTPYLLGGFYSGKRGPIPTNFEYFLGRSDWYSRHQSLLPLGTAIMIVGIDNLWKNNSRHAVVSKSIVVLCFIFNLGFGFEYVTDFYKQQEISYQISEADNSQFINELQIIDNSMLLNARGRDYRARDWLGLVSRAVGLTKALEIQNLEGPCRKEDGARFMLINGPSSHWEALKNLVSKGDMGFKVFVSDTPGACKPEMITSEKVSGAIPILFYFTGARN